MRQWVQRDGTGLRCAGQPQQQEWGAYTFDFGNRLRSTAAGTSSYAYDGYGRRVLDQTAAGAKYSHYNQAGQLTMTGDGRANTVNEYIHLNGSLIATRERDTLTNVYSTRYYHTDALGSPVAVSDPNRAILETSQYEPYGHLLNRPLQDKPGYAGHVSDAATGLNYMQQRYMDPKIGGRFLSVDPVTADNVGGNFNRYWYASDNPYRFKDPDGRADLNFVNAQDGTWTASNRFDIPGFTTVVGHANAMWFRDDRQKINSYRWEADRIVQLIDKVHKPGDWIFLGGCSIGLADYAQAIAKHYQTNVIATPGYLVVPSTSRGWVPGGDITLTANTQRDGNGDDSAFRIFTPDGKGMSGEISKITMKPDGKVTFSAAKRDSGQDAQRNPIDPEKPK